MKITIATILTLFCVILNAQNDGNTLEVDIRGRDCKGGIGICTTEISNDENQNSEKFSLLKISETELQFTIKTKELTIEDQKFIFGKEVQYISETDKIYFNQDYDFELNYDCIKLLGLNSKSSTIKNGAYPIKLINDRAIIILKLFNKI